MGVNRSASLGFILGNGTTAGGNDALRITDAGPPVITFNTTQGSDFDYVCESCGRHSYDEFQCCGTVKWHQDVLAVREGMMDFVQLVGPHVPGRSKALDHLVRLGILQYDFDNDKIALANRKVPWLGIAPANAIVFSWAIDWQQQQEIELLKTRVEELEHA